MEVGVHRAEFASEFLHAWRGVKLLLVDPWAKFDGPTGHGDREVDLGIARQRMAPFLERAVFLRTTSLLAARDTPDESLCSVYIDADHSYDHVTEDLRAWWPKVEPRGVLAGHDFLMHGDDRCGVQQAVIEFAGWRGGVDVYMIVEPLANPWSFYMVKT